MPAGDSSRYVQFDTQMSGGSGDTVTRLVLDGRGIDVRFLSRADVFHYTASVPDRSLRSKSAFLQRQRDKSAGT